MKLIIIATVVVQHDVGVEELRDQYQAGNVKEAAQNQQLWLTQTPEVLHDILQGEHDISFNVIGLE